MGIVKQRRNPGAGRASDVWNGLCAAGGGEVAEGRQALAAWVDQEERHTLTLEALDEADAGRLITRRAVRAWANSLGTGKPLSPPSA